MRVNVDVALSSIAQGYAEQFPQYERMLSLAQEQEQCLKEEDMSTDYLEGLIVERQELIETLEQGNLKMQQLKIDVCCALQIEIFTINVLKDKLSGPGLVALEQVVQRLTQVLREIKDLDGKNEEVLQSRIKETTEKLNLVKQSKLANKAYQKKGKQGEGVLVDFSK